MRIIASLSSSWEIDPSNSVEAPNDVNPPFVIGISQRSKENSLLVPCGNIILLLVPGNTTGARDGVLEGVFVGATLGKDDGDFVGFSVGADVGCVGALEGASEGMDVNGLF